MVTWPGARTEFKPFTLPTIDTDVFVLAGDIGVGIEGVKLARAWSAAQPVVYAIGKHEHYKQRWPEHVQRMRETASGSQVSGPALDTAWDRAAREPGARGYRGGQASPIRRRAADPDEPQLADQSTLN